MRASRRSLGRRPAVLASLVVALGGCGGELVAEAPSLDASPPDAGSSQDAMTPTDAGATSMDAGPGAADAPANDDGGPGGCGAACMGTCRAGRCLTRLSGSVPRQWGLLAVDATNVYWTDYLAGTLMTVPLAGGMTTTIASGTGFATGVATDPSGIYFADEGPTSGPAAGTIVKLGRGGGTSTLVSSTLPSAIAVSGGTVFWAGPQSLVATSLATGTSLTLATTQSFAGNPSVAVAGSSVAWMNAADGSILLTPVAGGATTTLVAAAQPVAMVADAANVYWTASAGIGHDAGAVLKVPIGGGTPVTLAPASPGAAWTSIAIDDQNVYFPGVESLCRVPIGGGATVTVADQRAADGIAVDATSAYFLGEDGVYRVTPK